MKWIAAFLSALWITGIVHTALEISRINEGLTDVPSDIDINVVKLALNANVISTIRQSDFNNKFPHLEFLAIVNNQISSIEPGSFKGTNLQKLYAHENLLTKVPDLSEIQDKLKILSLSQNPITEITQEDFNDKFPALGQLYLERNDITTIEDGCFRGTQISRLDLEYNFLTSIPDVSEIRTTLKELRLYENKITAIRASSFQAGFDQLWRLQLYSNEITTIEPGSFNGLPALERLDLHLNSITSLRSSDFNILHALETLKISSNFFKYIPDLKIPTLTNLQVESLNIYCCQSAAWVKNVTELDDSNLECSGPVKWKTSPFSSLNALELQQEQCCEITSVL